MHRDPSVETTVEPLVELAPEESVLRALAQSAHPVEFIASNLPQDTPDPAQS